MSNNPTEVPPYDFTPESLRDEFTYSQPCCVDGEPDAHTTWIKVGVQSFAIDGYQETKEAADWMRLMLGKAFQAMISSVGAGVSSPAAGASLPESSLEKTARQMAEVLQDLSEYYKQRPEIWRSPITGAPRPDDPLWSLISRASTLAHYYRVGERGTVCDMGPVREDERNDLRAEITRLRAQLAESVPSCAPAATDAETPADKLADAVELLLVSCSDQKSWLEATGVLSAHYHKFGFLKDGKREFPAAPSVADAEQEEKTLGEKEP